MNPATAQDPSSVDEALKCMTATHWKRYERSLAERNAVEEKLRVAAIAMGHGSTRGWRTRLPGKFIGEG